MRNIARNQGRRIKPGMQRRDLIFGAIVLLIATLAYILGWTNLFTVRDISVTGAPTQQIRAQVLQIADIQRGEKLARVEPRKVSNNLALAGINWIVSVDISRNWITRSVNINLKARQPIAKAGDQLLDSAGVLFTSPVQLPKSSQDLIAIVTPNSSARVAAVEFLKDLPKDFAAEIGSISAATMTSSNSKSDSSFEKGSRNLNYQFELTLKNGLIVSWGENKDLILKIKIYKALLNLPENKRIKSMDLTDPTKPSVI